MALDTLLSIQGKVLLRCPSAPVLLARDWVSQAFRRVAERRPWSWLIKQDQFNMPSLYNTGTVTLTEGDATVIGAGTAWTSAMAGRQFRYSKISPIYTITTVDAGAQTLELDIAWGAATVTLATYEIYAAYKVVPTDFHHFITIWDPNFNWQLYRNVTQNELNLWDAQRSNRGQSYVVAHRDYYTPSGSTIPRPRYEIWPHKISAYVFPFLYISRPTDLEDSGATLPWYIRGDLLLEMALAEAAKWPGPSAGEDKYGRKVESNPYFNLNLAKMHEQRAEYMITEAERQDDEVSIMSITYEQSNSMPWAPMLVDTNFWQSHAI